MPVRTEASLGVSVCSQCYNSIFVKQMRADTAVQITSGNKIFPHTVFLRLPLWSHHPASPPTPSIIPKQLRRVHTAGPARGGPHRLPNPTSGHCKCQHGSVSHRTIPVPKSCSPKVVEGETKGAAPPEQPGKGARRREGPSAGKSHACPPACPPYGGQTKGQKNKEKRARGTRSIHARCDDSDQDKEFPRHRRPSGPGLQ